MIISVVDLVVPYISAESIANTCPGNKQYNLKNTNQSHNISGMYENMHICMFVMYMFNIPAGCRVVRCGR